MGVIYITFDELDLMGSRCVPMSRRTSSRRSAAGAGSVLDRSGEGFLDKDEALVRMIHRDFGGPLFGHVLRLTGNDRQWAEDVVQETLVRAWRNADRLDRESIGVRAWLYTVARNLVIDGRRSSKVRPHEVDAASLETMTIPDD